MDVAKNDTNHPSLQRHSGRSLDRFAVPSFRQRTKSQKEDNVKKSDPTESLTGAPTILALNPLHSPPSSSLQKPIPVELLLLVEKLVEPLTDSSKKGIGRTRLILDLKGLSKVEIVIDHYDTAPHTFHIRLMGNEKAQLLFNQHKNALESQLKTALPTFHCLISAPTYRPKSFLKNRGKEKNTLEKSDELKYGGVKKALEANG